MMVGGFLYPFSEFATPADKMAERPGYQADTTAAITEARQLLAAAGYPQGLKNLDFVVRDINTFKLWAVAIQAMLKEALNIDTTLRTVQVSVWFDEAQAGTFDLTISAIVSTLIDPSDYFNAWYRQDGPQNYSKWANPAFQALLPQIDRELDATQRKALIRQSEAIMEQDPPLLPVAWSGSTTAGTTTSRGIIPPTTSGSMMWYVLIPSGWISRGGSMDPMRPELR